MRGEVVGAAPLPRPRLLLLLLGLSLPERAAGYHDGFRLSAYADIVHGPWFPEHKMGNVDWARVSQRASDLMLFSIEPSSDGELVVLEHLPAEVIAAARLAREQHPFVRLHVCVGGPGKSGAFSSLVINLGARRKLVAALMELVLQEDLDGIDFAWDDDDTAAGAAGVGSLNPSLESGFGQLVAELKAAALKEKAFTKPKLIVTLLVKPGEHHPQAFTAADYARFLMHKFRFFNRK